MRIGYLTSVYPAISHTFVRREIEALRRRNIDVDTFTVRQSPDFDALSEQDKREFEKTWTIIPPAVSELVKSHVSAIARHPGRYVDALKLALNHHAPGARNTVWSMFHFVEGVHLARQLEERKLEHLRVHFGTNDSLIAMVAADVAGIGWSIALHGSPCFDGLRKVLGEKVSRASFVTCVSNYGRAQAYWASDPAYWDRVMLVRCGIEADVISSRKTQKSARSRPRVVTVARLSPEKGLLGLIDAFDQVIKKGVDAELRIIGEGSERKRIEEHIAALGLQDRVSLPGHASHTKVLEEIADADVFALASFMEGLPVVLMESLALGTPAVAPRLTGIPELIEHEKTGLLFTPAVWSDLAWQLQRLLESVELRAKLAEFGRERVRAEFDSDRAVEPLVEKLKEVVRK